MTAVLYFAAFNIDNKYNSTKEEEYRESYFPYPVWKEPAMHQVLVDVALGGAQAFILSQRPARMSHNVLLRIDIALTQHDGMVGLCSWKCSICMHLHKTWDHQTLLRPGLTGKKSNAICCNAGSKRYWHLSHSHSPAWNIVCPLLHTIHQCWSVLQVRSNMQRCTLPGLSGVYQLQVRPFINEAHYYADATLMFPVWPPEPKAAHLNWHGQAAQHAQQHTPDAVPQEVSGWGLWLAEHLWKEAKLRISCDRQHLVA